VTPRDDKRDDKYEFDYDAYAEYLSTRGDSGHVLLSTAITEERIELLLLSHFQKLSNTVAKRLFDGPLSSLAAKIDLAYALGLIETETHRDLRTLVEIRNEFAHSRKYMSLLSPEMVKLCRKFNGWHLGADSRELLDARVTVAQKVIEEKLEAQIYAHATRA
jgi:DNA-binding MltR family transcriptional regulator